MYEQNFTSEPQNCTSGLNIFKQIVGYLLIAGGVYIAVWAFSTIRGVFTDPNVMLPFQEIIASKIEAVANIDGSQTSVVIPTEMIAFVIPLVLLGITAGIAATFIKGGTALLDDSLKKFIKKLTAIEQHVKIKKQL